MSLLLPPPVVFPATFHVNSQPLDDEVMRQVEEHLADKQAIDAAEHARLLEHLLANAADDAVAALTQGIKLLAVPEQDDEEIDSHSCADSGCAGEHTHADYDDDYECGHRSPYAGTPSYMPDTCYEGIDYSRMPESD